MNLLPAVAGAAVEPAKEITEESLAVTKAALAVQDKIGVTPAYAAQVLRSGDEVQKRVQAAEDAAKARAVATENQKASANEQNAQIALNEGGDVVFSKPE